MYAIIQDGGKQYKVTPGTIIEIEKKEVEPGKTVEFPHVLYYKYQDQVEIGTPQLSSFKVKGVVERQKQGPKLIAFKFRKREAYHRKIGHRQQYTRVRITEIVKEQ